MTQTLNLTTATPAEIDGELARIHGEAGRINAQFVQARETERFYTTGKGNYSHNAAERAAEYAAKAEKLFVQLTEKQAESKPFNAEFERRGGWTRAFLVNNVTGHVHSSMDCNTCYPSTEYLWLTEYSDHDENEIVSDAGERACTRCYPTAPVDVLKRATKIFTPDEKAAQDRKAALEAKRAEAAKATVVHPISGKVLFKTERGATNEISNLLQSAHWYPRSADEYRAQAGVIILAVAAKRGTDPVTLMIELDAKAAAKVKKERG